MKSTVLCVCFLNSGRILLFGARSVSKRDSGASLTSAVELLDLTNHQSVLIGQLHEARLNPLSVSLGNDIVAVIGGTKDDYTPLDKSNVKAIEIYEGKTSLATQREPQPTIGLQAYYLTQLLRNRCP